VWRFLASTYQVSLKGLSSKAQSLLILLVESQEIATGCCWLRRRPLDASATIFVWGKATHDEKWLKIDTFHNTEGHQTDVAQCCCLLGYAAESKYGAMTHWTTLWVHIVIFHFVFSMVSTLRKSKVQTLTVEFAVDLGSCLRWGKAIAPSLWPVTDVLDLQEHWAEVQLCFVRVRYVSCFL
jgi:hypothetical protein